MKHTICIIEDDEAVRESLRLLLELRGFCVEEYDEGSKLLSRPRFDDLHCIILDLNLPGENGLQILSRLRAGGVTTPAFIVTGRADAFLRQEARRLNAIGVFEKPLTGRELLAAIAASSSPPSASS